MEELIALTVVTTLVVFAAAYALVCTDNLSSGVAVMKSAQDGA